MKEIVIDGKLMKDKESAHNVIKEAFNFPDYYGRNLDALWDMLSEMSDPVKITLTGSSQARKALGKYFVDIIKVFYDAAKEDDVIKFICK